MRIWYRDVPSPQWPSYPYVSSAKVGAITMSGDNRYFDSKARFWEPAWHVFRVLAIVDQGHLMRRTPRPWG
ncbi:MAG: hypothetical protein ACREUT_14230 [Steroidobacteraceae bacterium]